jgi:hypothetical protein
MSSATSIVDLSADVLYLIFEQLPLSSHFDFACMCKRIAVESQDVLRRHQQAHAKFSVASDLDPTTVPLLLESAFGADRILAWHVRSFEVWRDRTSWDEWETYSLYTPVNFGIDGLVSDLDILSFQPLLERVGGYLDWYEGYSHGTINRKDGFAQLERGHDGLLKALLFAKLPRLRDLKFVTRSQTKDSTLYWLKTLIKVSKAVHPEPDNEGLSQSDDEASSERSTTDTHEASEHDARLLQLQIDSCHSPTQSEFDQEWDVAYAKWSEEQKVQELGNHEIDEPKKDAISTHDPEVDLCERGAKSACSQDDGAGLDQDIPSVCATQTSLWPAGFTALRSVAVGVVSETWMDDDEYPQSDVLVACFIRLPNLDTLYFNGFRCEQDDGSKEYDYDADIDGRVEDEETEMIIYDLASHSASVKHLFFEGLWFSLESDFVAWLCKVPRDLRTVALRNSGPYAGDFTSASFIVGELQDNQGSSLESLMWYGFDSSSAHSGECSVVSFEEDTLDRFPKLKHLSLNVHDLATGVYRSTWGDTPKGYESYNDYYVQYVTEALPKSLESLVLWEDAGSGVCGDETGETVLLERAITKIIEGGSYKHLKSIFLDQVERATDCGEGKVSFDRAVTAGRAAGVDLFTLANRPTEQSMPFPEPVDQYDLRTGKYPGGRPNDWVFDCYAGCRKPPQ